MVGSRPHAPRLRLRPRVTSVLFAKQGFDVHGFDISPQNVARATALAQRYGLSERAHFSVQAAEHLTYPNDCFDVVVGLDILHHVEIGTTIRECLRVLKPGGNAVFHEPVEAMVFDRLRTHASAGGSSRRRPRSIDTSRQTSAS